MECCVNSNPFPIYHSTTLKITISRCTALMRLSRSQPCPMLSTHLLYSMKLWLKMLSKCCPSPIKRKCSIIEKNHTRPPPHRPTASPRHNHQAEQSTSNTTNVSPSVLKPQLVLIPVAYSQIPSLNHKYGSHPRISPPSRRLPAKMAPFRTFSPENAHSQLQLPNPN